MKWVEDKCVIVGVRISTSALLFVGYLGLLINQGLKKDIHSIVLTFDVRNPIEQFKSKTNWLNVAGNSTILEDYRHVFGRAGSPKINRPLLR